MVFVSIPTASDGNPFTTILAELRAFVFPQLAIRRHKPVLQPPEVASASL